jgi:cellulose synthase/poly-beta-1,6-N-acetylglucosamine synthase-like glycosyltransferase
MSGATAAGAVWVFWVCLLLIAHTYILYPIVLFVASSLEQIRRDWRYLTRRRSRRHTALKPEHLPALSLIVPAYNEQDHLAGKIANLGELDYPPAKLEVVFVSDGSTDRTNEILQALDKPQIQALFLRVRAGKANALNRGVERAKHDILVFSDASTLFAPDALRQLVRHFEDPRVGVVCGALQFRGNDEYRQTEGVYWQYESMLRLMEGRLGATLTASGAVYALRRRCYVALPPDVIIEDFVVPMNARKLGYRVLYDPEVVATDFAASSVAGEFTRRVRIAAGSFRALHDLVRIPFHFFTYLAFFSHKLLRWILPFLLIGLLASSSLLWSSPAYRMAFIGQLLFYLWAGIGFLFRQRMLRFRYALVGYYLLAIHLAFLVGFFQFLRGRQVTWQRVS